MPLPASSAVPPELHQSVQAWLAADPDPRTRGELTRLLDAADTDPAALDALADRFAGRLQFGTAGLRGELGAGPNRMNRAVVIQTAAGLASYLSDEVGRGRVAVGYDARHDSDVFAADSAAVLAAAGLKPLVLPQPLPTPVLAFAVRDLGCVAGIMVTASHNPPLDNGYKVYLGDGCQIVPPTDQEIANRIAGAPPASSIPRADTWTVMDDTVADRYVDAVSAVGLHGAGFPLRMVYTPLHGVGAAVVEQVLQRAGFDPPVVVAAQATPDANFPTVAFPNPEEPGALDLAIEAAEHSDADLVLANDPDADRCATAVPAHGEWRVLRGDEVGVLLADVLLRRGVTGTYATTVVSSSLLEKMARDFGVPYVETLTGFKWLGRVPDLAYGYEEALGYCVAPDLVRDKDGISALLLLAATAADCKAQGRSLLDRLDDLAQRYGVHLTDQLSIRVAEVASLNAVMQELRLHPPSRLGGMEVEDMDDLLAGFAGSPGTDAVRYRLSGGGRVVVRPSGTEPKLKGYLEVVEPVVGAALGTARAEAAGRLAALRVDVSRLLNVP